MLYEPNYNNPLIYLNEQDIILLSGVLRGGGEVLQELVLLCKALNNLQLSQQHGTPSINKVRVHCRLSTLPCFALDSMNCQTPTRLLNT